MNQAYILVHLSRCRNDCGRVASCNDVADELFTIADCHIHPRGLASSQVVPVKLLAIRATCHAMFSLSASLIDKAAGIVSDAQQEGEKQGVESNLPWGE
jgi:hypothetical protein